MRDHIDRTIGCTLRTLRQEANLTQVTLANRLGMPQSRVSKLESAQRTLQMHDVFELAGGLGITPEELTSRICRDVRTSFGETLERR